MGSLLVALSVLIGLRWGGRGMVYAIRFKRFLLFGHSQTDYIHIWRFHEGLYNSRSDRSFLWAFRIC